MTFTPEQTEALDKIEELFGPTEVDLDYLRDTYDYEAYAESQIRYFLHNYASHKVISSTSWQEIQRQRKEAAAARLAERSEGIRDGIVLSALSGLVTKSYKSLKDVWVAFDVDENGGNILAWNHVTQDRIFKINYSKEDLKVYTDLAAEGLTFEDDVTVISGNVSPRRQLTGLTAVMSYLEEQENKA